MLVLDAFFFGLVDVRSTFFDFLLLLQQAIFGGGDLLLEWQFSFGEFALSLIETGLLFADGFVGFLTCFADGIVFQDGLGQVHELDLCCACLTAGGDLLSAHALDLDAVFLRLHHLQDALGLGLIFGEAVNVSHVTDGTHQI